MTSTQPMIPPSGILVIPSMGFSGLTRKYLTGLDAFEERGLYSLSKLVDTSTKVHFVTSQDLDPDLIDHCLDLIAGTTGTRRETLRERLTITKLSDRRNESLTAKLLEMPLDEIRTLCPHSPKEIDFWIFGPEEARLSGMIGVEPQGDGYAHDLLDDKSNTRRIFRELGISTPPGRDSVHSFDQVLEGIREMDITATGGKFILKLNKEDGGMGIGLIDSLSPVADVETLRSNLRTARGLPILEFEQELAGQGGVLERFVEFPFSSAPSVKMEVLGDGTVRNLATHEQIMDGTACAGCSFPANPEYRGDLIQLGYRVADFAAENGFRGIISVDFLAVKSRPEEQWQLFGIEINARKGGTTHPYFWTKSITNAVYDENEGILISEGDEVKYSCHESVGCPELKGIPPAAVLSRIKEAGLVFDRKKNSGILVHMIGRLKSCGTIGVTIIGGTDSELDHTLNTLKHVLRAPFPNKAEVTCQY